MDIETSIIRLFQLKQSMELSDLVIGSQIEENLKLNIEAIENVLSELERLEKYSLDVKLLTEDLNKARKENHEENIRLQMERDKYKELETYKKIAEKLAEEIADELAIDEENRNRIKSQYLEDTRKEVEKDE